MQWLQSWQPFLITNIDNQSWQQTLNTLWRYAHDLTKSQKRELITESLSNMDPRDASASKKKEKRVKMERMDKEKRGMDKDEKEDE